MVTFSHLSGKRSNEQWLAMATGAGSDLDAGHLSLLDEPFGMRLISLAGLIADSRARSIGTSGN